MNTVDALAGGDITKWYDILAMPYIEVFTKLVKDKTTNDYRKKYEELLQASKD